jgi:methyl-accepting chemotaxis protein
MFKASPLRITVWIKLYASFLSIILFMVLFVWFGISSMKSIQRIGAIHASEEGKHIYQTYINASILFTVLIVILLTTLAFLIARSISKPINQVSKELQLIAAGDLSLKQLKVRNTDEIGDLVQSFNKMTRDIRSLFDQVCDSTNQVTTFSEKLFNSTEKTSQAAIRIATAIQSIAMGSETQMQSTLESSRAMEEMAIGIQRIAETTSRVSTSASEASDKAVDGNESILQAILQMHQINTTVGNFALEIQDLHRLSEEIGNNITNITHIASQTNLLALNAAIEAARAGEHGRGFAVVSQEIRKLSDQTEVSAHKITDMLSLIQNKTNAAMSRMDMSISEIEIGIRTVVKAGEMFETIVYAAEHVCSEIYEAAAISEQMSASSEEVAASLAEMAQISYEYDKGSQKLTVAIEEQLSFMRETSSTADVLSHAAQNLKTLVKQFKI